MTSNEMPLREESEEDKSTPPNFNSSSHRSSLMIASIFDEENSTGHTKWNVSNEPFRDLEHKKTLMEGPLIHYSAKEQTYKNKYRYRLSEEYFICVHGTQKESKKIRYFKIPNLYLQKLEPRTVKDEVLFGFKLSSRKKGSWEFFSKKETIIQEWFDALKKWCIQLEFEKSFSQVRHLGKGNFARVFLGTNLMTGQEVAVKCYDKKEIDKNPRIRTAIINEISILRLLDHKYIVKLYEVFESEEYVFMVMELLAGGELFKRIHRVKVSEKEAAGVIVKVSEALEYLHTRKIIHRDIKLENILLLKESSLDVIKIIDFGFATKIDQISTLKKCGTPGYAAPELLLEKDYNQKADYFSLGVCLFIMLCGKPAFRGQTFQEILICNSVCHFRFSKHLWTGITYSALDMVKHLMHPDPEQRFDHASLMRHQWTIHNTASLKGAPKEKLEKYDGEHEINPFPHDNRVNPETNSSATPQGRKLPTLRDDSSINPSSRAPQRSAHARGDRGDDAKTGANHTVHSSTVNYDPTQGLNHLLQVPGGRDKENSYDIGTDESSAHKVPGSTYRREESKGRAVSPNLSFNGTLSLKTPVVPSKNGDVKKYALMTQLRKIMKKLKVEVPINGFDINLEINSLLKLDSFYRCNSIESNNSNDSGNLGGGIPSRRITLDGVGHGGQRNMSPMNRQSRFHKNETMSKWHSADGSRFFDVESRTEKGVQPVHIKIAELARAPAPKFFGTFKRGIGVGGPKKK